MTDWNPEQYHRFHDERRQPFVDLLALVHPEPAMRVVDLGCGTGELTDALHQQLGARETLGIDTSAAMLRTAAELTQSGLHFARCDLATFTNEAPFDLVFSNAAIHWVDDHPALLERLTGLLAPHGQLAVQVPANHDHPSHTVARDVAREAPFAAALEGYERQPSVLPPETYAALLDRLGYRRQHVRLQVYGHHLAARDAVVEWVKGTLLVDYQQRLSPPLFQEFLERYRAVLLPRLADERPYFYPFKRILFWARR